MCDRPYLCDEEKCMVLELERACYNEMERELNIPPQTGQQNGENRSRDTAETSPGVRLQVQAVE